MDSDGKPFETQRSRIVRVARGSGTSVHEVEEILEQFKKFAQMVKTMGGKGGLLKNMPTDPRRVNPNQMASMARLQQQMMNMIPPEVMNRMGGMEGIQRMARQFAGGRGGGMPDMQKMMSQMFGGR